MILCIETSSSVCSVCVASGGNLLDYREDQSKNSHARVITLLVDDLLKSLQITYHDLDAIAVSAGPGSYTGLRIGVSAAKGFCYALNKPLIAIPTLTSLAYAIQQKVGEKACLMPVIDARRMDAYMAVYDYDLNEVVPASMSTINEELEEKLMALGPIIIGGDAAEKCSTIFKAANFSYVDAIHCDSRLLIKMAQAKFDKKDFADVAYFEPLYINEFAGVKPKR